MRVMSMSVGLLCVLGVGGATAPLLAQSDFTHVLELVAAEAPEPSRVEATLTVDGSEGTITLAMPDGEMLTVDCVLPEPDQIKFQMSRIGGGRLANVQFIGSGSVAAGFRGSFTGMVDGEHRPDMSGTFTLLPRQ